MFDQSYLVENFRRSETTNFSSEISEKIHSYLCSELRRTLETFDEGIIFREPEDFSVLLCGSLGRGEWTLSSDIDLTIIHRKNVDLSKSSKINSVINRLQTDKLPIRGIQLISMKESSLSTLLDSGIYTLLSILDSVTIAGSKKIRSETLSLIKQIPGIRRKTFNYLREELHKSHTFMPEKPELKECAGGLRYIQNSLRIFFLDKFFKEEKIDTANFSVENQLKALVLNGHISKSHAAILLETYGLFLNWQNLNKSKSGSDLSDIYKDFADFMMLENSAEAVRSLIYHTGHAIEILDTSLKNYSSELRIINFKKYNFYCDDFNRVIHNVEREDRKPIEKNIVELSLILLEFISKRNLTLSYKYHVKLLNLISDNIFQFHEYSEKKFGSALYKILLNEYSSSAIEFAMDLTVDSNNQNHFRTIADYLIPGLDKTRCMITEPEIHDTALDIHLLDCLRNCEKKLFEVSGRFKEEYSSLDEFKIFALKYCCLTHDLGKTIYEAGHEKTGGDMAAENLQIKGLLSKSRREELVRFLIYNHQEPEKIIRISEYPEDAPPAFLELCSKDNTLMILLYILCYCDMEAVGIGFRPKLQVLEDLYLQCINLAATGESGNILREIQKQNDRELTRLSDNYLYIKFYLHSLEFGIPEYFTELAKRKKGEEKVNKTLEPLKNILTRHRSGNLSEKLLLREKDRFLSELKRIMTVEDIRIYYKDEYPRILWFFASFPNRFLLGTPIFVLTNLANLICETNESETILEFIPPDAEQPPRVIFYRKHGEGLIDQVAYYLNFFGVNIENGKINTILFKDGGSGVAGYFDLQNEPEEETKNRFRNSILSEEFPDKPHAELSKIDPDMFELDIITDQKRPYVIEEKIDGTFSRATKTGVAIKLSMPNSDYAFFRFLQILRGLNTEIFQVTAATYGSKIYDYFYIPEISDSTGLCEKIRKAVIEEFC